MRNGETVRDVVGRSDNRWMVDGRSGVVIVAELVVACSELDGGIGGGGGVVLGRQRRKRKEEKKIEIRK